MKIYYVRDDMTMEQEFIKTNSNTLTNTTKKGAAGMTHWDFVVLYLVNDLLNYLIEKTPLTFL